VSPPAVPPFDVCGDLPVGTTVLEASAGTGKTFTIAALATRYVAEGVAELSELMLVTFSRAATQELRERVRERLGTAAQGLADPAGARAGADALLRLLATGSEEEVRLRRRRLSRALADFDAATIATTHGFCQQMLAGLGMAGDTDPDARFVEHIDDLVPEVVDDLYLRKFVRDATPPALDYACARKVARDAMADRAATLAPADAEAGSPAQQRYGMASAVRREVAARKRARRLLDYDDLLTRLRDALVDPARGPAAAHRIRARYRVVLVDEFQDTDPVQWQILAAAFHGHTTLVLIGDPKQAVYAFRGADLVTYLNATRAATTRRTLGRSWRSDAHLLAALERVFGGAALGDPDIVVRPVAAEHRHRRLHDAGAPVRLRVVSRPGRGDVPGGMPGVEEIRAHVARDVAGDVVRLLSGPAALALDGSHHAGRPVRPGDVAVLVRTNDTAFLVRDALAAARVPAVLTSSRSVFLSRLAGEWLTLLRALEQPHRAGLVRAAALTCFLGWTAERLATAGEAALDQLGGTLREWRDLLAGRGVAALLEVMTTAGGVVERLLGTPAGERDVTDLRHIGQSLHAAATEGHLGQAALAEWLARRLAGAAEDSAEERSRRLESDADAVQVVTIHGSKGLEFPVVYVPFGWDRFVGRSPDLLRLHAPEGTRLLDVGGSGGPAYAEHRRAHEAEESGEDLRLLYVAMTRAQCQVVAWWAPSRNTPAAPLHRLLFGDFGPGEQPPLTVPVPSDAAAYRRLEAAAAAAGGTIAVEPVAADPGPVRPWEPPAPPSRPLSAATFDRGLDTAWRRTSYTGLTAALHHAAASPGVGSEPEVAERADEPVAPAAPLAAPAGQAGRGGDGAPGAAAGVEARLRSVPSPMADLPAGTAFGTLVHGVLETVDTAAGDLAEELHTRCAQALAGRLGAPVDAAALATALLAVMETPLGPLAGNRRLRDVPPADRLAELAFELPLAGGDRPAGADADVAAVADLLRRRLPGADPLAAYPGALDAPALRHQHLRGYLIGSIDAVLRFRDAGQPRFVVVDYKTNWLGDAGPAGPEPLTAWHYRPAALAADMVGAHYPLQALFYSVALHRFLRWRQPGYDPERHLGGILYLYLRGMCGASTPAVDGTPCGVFTWQPPPGLVEDLSTLLHGGDR
jgi:exodeoxyribonuclease V beta subunit